MEARVTFPTPRHLLNVNSSRSLGLPRWRTCQIPDPGEATKCQNPYTGEGSLNQIPAGTPPHPGCVTLTGA